MKKDNPDPDRMTVTSRCPAKPGKPHVIKPPKGGSAICPDCGQAVQGPGEHFPKIKYKSMEELIREILWHDDLDRLVIETEEKNFETTLTLYLKRTNKSKVVFEDCMMDGAVLQAADYLGIKSEKGA